eukprot:TRINITY_DN23673_c0_g1_i1.p1 TRINITY_DN23673_c0_g1~~TRINITY_DN23673_c0_g1_i1.p1  ORF type:complete len:334 (+),score=65.21 TRINITY_DN23673_c0_g1_i1:32-1003(+)
MLGRVLCGSPRRHSSMLRASVLRCASSSLNTEELYAWSNRTAALAQDHPALARELLNEFVAFGRRAAREPPTYAEASTKELGNAKSSGDAATLRDEVVPPCGEVHVLQKVADAKLKRGRGQGKTMLFAYLGNLDKARVLELTGAESAHEAIARGTGKTAFFASLPGEVKYKALIEWQREREGSAPNVQVPAAPPTNMQLAKLAILVGSPMVGFGFVDNVLMICFGDLIEFTFGQMFGMSTMAAAAWGNLCSDAAGVGLADYIEHAGERLGLPNPSLTNEQRQMSSAKFVSTAAAVGGISFGCILGMVPLLFTDTGKRDAQSKE